MSDKIITVRDIDIVATEINTIKSQARRVVLSAALEIGSRLVEAKAMIQHGEWGKWLADAVDYSQSTAENLMRLYNEYGSNQESLFAEMTKSQAIGKLSYTQAMELLALPAPDRADFVATHDMDEITTRELKAEIQRLKEAKAAAEKSAQETTADAKEIAFKLRQAQSARDDYKGQLDTAMERAKKAESQVDTTREDLIRANLDLDKARKALNDARKNPQIPAETLEKIRTEAASSAASEKVQALEKALAAAEDAAKTAQADARQLAAMAAKAETAKTAQRMASPEVAVFKQIFDQIQPLFAALVKNYQAVQQSDPDTAAGLRKAMAALLANFQAKIQG